MYRPTKDQDSESHHPYIRSIVKTLNSLDRPGSFASGGQFQFPLPALKINGVEGYVGLPVCEFQAKAIMSVCTQAPFGKGPETVVDRSVRNTWELNPSQFTIADPQWSSRLKNLAAVVKKELGCDPKLKVKCDLYKFLLYEQGSFFKPHRDTEKVDKMFGTLVIQLPSDYDGGELRVRHHKEEQIFDYSGLQGISKFHYAAFYADCEHELCEVTRGYRLCLVYNLVYSGNGTCPVPIDNCEAVAEVVEDMRKWEQDDNGLPFMVYVLNHSYCEASLSFGLLKNGDRAKGEVFLEAQKQSEFCLYLGILTFEWHAYGDSYGRSRSSFSIQGIEEEFNVDKLVSPTGEFLDGVERFNDVIANKDIFESMEPAREYYEPTGNEGTTLEKTYHQVALFIWPRRHTILVTGVEKAIDNLNSKLCDSQQQQGECENLAKEIVGFSKNSYFWPNDQKLFVLLSCLKQLKALFLVFEMFKGIAVHRLHLLQYKAKPFCEAIREFGTAFGWEQLEEALVALVESAVAKEISIGCSFLSSLATDSLLSQRLKVCQKMVDVVCHALTIEQDIDHINPQSLVCLTAQGFRSKEFICELFTTLCALQCEDQLGVVIPSFFRQPNRYSLHKTLVPAAIELHETMKENSSTALTSLISQCVSALECETQQAPTWSLKANLNCQCELCAVLAAFLKDPQKSVARFRMKQSNRNHLEQQLWNSRSDAKCTTERHASPHTLVVTKKDVNFKAHQAILALLDRIRPLLDKEKPLVKRQKLEDD